MKLFIHEAAERDILHEVGRYAEMDLVDVGRRFHAAVMDGIDAILRTPSAGSPKSVHNIQLTGLRAWPVKRFKDFRIYYLVRDDALIILRVLHGKRDLRKLLEDNGTSPKQ